MARIEGADTSKFATGNLPVSPNMLLNLRTTRNVELFIPGAWHGAEGYDAVRPSLDSARALNMKTATYVALTRKGKGAEDVLEAYKLVGETAWRPLSFVALDMEYGDPADGNVADMTDLYKAIEKCLTLNARPILYTAGWWWKGHFGNPNIPTNLPLWNAFYDNDPDFDFATYPYGGPNVNLIGEQYTNTTTVIGPDGTTVGFDFNSFDADWVNAFPMSGLAGLQALVEAWESDMSDTIKGAAALHQGGIDPTRLALFGYRQLDKARAWSALLGK